MPETEEPRITERFGLDKHSKAGGKLIECYIANYFFIAKHPTSGYLKVVLTFEHN